MSDLLAFALTVLLGGAVFFLCVLALSFLSAWFGGDIEGEQ